MDPVPERLEGLTAELLLDVRTPAELTEGHVPVERAHALDAIRRTQSWFDRYLRPER